MNIIISIIIVLCIVLVIKYYQYIIFIYYYCTIESNKRYANNVNIILYLNHDMMYIECKGVYFIVHNNAYYNINGIVNKHINKIIEECQIPGIILSNPYYAAYIDRFGDLHTGVLHVELFKKKYNITEYFATINEEPYIVTYKMNVNYLNYFHKMNKNDSII